MPSTVVLGLDGANWALLQPWLDDGELPNLAELRRSGVHADLESCLPPVTCPNWRCYSTGKNPGKLGVYWWEHVDTDARSLWTPDAGSFDSADYWDYLNDDDRSVGVMNLPMTYPPADVDEFLLSGGPDCEDEGYASPDEIERALAADGYAVHPERPVDSSADYAAGDDVVDLIDRRFEAFERLLEERSVDVAHLTIFYSNVLQHFFWRDDPTLAAWRVIDEHLGRLRESYPEATFVLFSDHGCTEIDTVFHANAWLEREGFLATTGGAASRLGRLGLNKERISGVAHRLGLRDVAAHHAPDWLLDRIPDSSAGFRRAQKLELVDWSETSAVASGQGLVWVVDDDQAVVEELVERLESLTDDDGRPVAKEVYTREEAYDGPHLDDAPAIVFDQREGVHTSGTIGDNPVFDEPGRWRAENVRTGLFLADGPDVEASSIDGPVSITDVAPTILHGLDAAIPSDVDGAPLPLFGDRPVETREPLRADAGRRGASEETQSRLQDLGYLE